MANRKISDLTTLTAPATGDLLPIVDISEAAAADKNKKITFGELLASAPAGSAAAPSFSFDGDPNTGIFNPAADTLAFAEGGSEVMRIDSSSRLLVGTSTSTSVAGSAATVQIFGTGGNPHSLQLTRGDAPILAFGKTDIGGGSTLGVITFAGNDGSDVNSVGALILGQIDGTIGVDDMPGRLVFSTTADGAASPTERMRIKSTGIINFSNVPTYADNTAATAGGLDVGDVYKTVLGVLMIRF
jgi:hypothetical protein